MSIYHDLHWHLDSWTDELTPYFEAIAFKRIDDNTWDIYFNEFQNEQEIREILGESNFFRDENFGLLIFNSPEDEVEMKFHIWVDTVLLPLRSN